MSNILSSLVVTWVTYYFLDVLVYCFSCILLNDLKFLGTQVATSFIMIFMGHIIHSSSLCFLLYLSRFCMLLPCNLYSWSKLAAHIISILIRWNISSLKWRSQICFPQIDTAELKSSSASYIIFSRN